MRNLRRSTSQVDDLVMHTLPGVLCRSEVIDIVYEQISPLGNALIEIERATKTLSNLSKGEVE